MLCKYIVCTFVNDPIEEGNEPIVFNAIQFHNINQKQTKIYTRQLIRIQINISQGSQTANCGGYRTYRKRHITHMTFEHA